MLLCVVDHPFINIITKNDFSLCYRKLNAKHMHFKNKEVKTVHRFWKWKVLIPTANMIAKANGKMTFMAATTPKKPSLCP